jgi:type IX secretion system PorP/SprF family membrane protein
MSLLEKKLFILCLMKKISLLILFAILSLEIFSQQDPQFAHNRDNLLFTNPGFAGMGDGICATAISRLQWVGFEGAPTTTLAGVHSGVKLFGINGGIGLTMMNDSYEFETNFQAKLSISYHRRMFGGVVGFGFEGGIINKDLNGDWVFPDTEVSNDPVIPNSQVQKILADFGAGIFYKVSDRFYAGVSISHLHKPKVAYTEPAAQGGTTETTASYLQRHYFGTAGYNFRLLNSPVELQPSVFVKYDGTKMQYSGNISALYNKKNSIRRFL